MRGSSGRSAHIGKSTLIDVARSQRIRDRSGGHGGGGGGEAAKTVVMASSIDSTHISLVRATAVRQLTFTQYSLNMAVHPIYGGGAPTGRAMSMTASVSHSGRRALLLPLLLLLQVNTFATVTPRVVVAVDKRCRLETPRIGDGKMQLSGKQCREAFVIELRRRRRHVKLSRASYIMYISLPATQVRLLPYSSSVITTDQSNLT